MKINVWLSVAVESGFHFLFLSLRCALPMRHLWLLLKCPSFNTEYFQQTGGFVVKPVAVMLLKLCILGFHWPFDVISVYSPLCSCFSPNCRIPCIKAEIIFTSEPAKHIDWEQNKWNVMSWINHLISSWWNWKLFRIKSFYYAAIISK